MFLSSPRDTVPKGIYFVCIDHHRKLKLYSANIKYITLEFLKRVCCDTHEKHGYQKMRSHVNVSERKYLYGEVGELSQGIIKIIYESRKQAKSFQMK